MMLKRPCRGETDRDEIIDDVRRSIADINLPFRG
jgi:hypothetical protein